MFYSADFVNISEIKGKNAVKIYWTAAPTSKEFRMAMDKLIEALVYYKATKILSLNEGLGAISEEDQNWSNTDWFGRAIAVGYNKLAVILSSDIFNQMSVEQILSKVAGVDIKYFDSESEAIAWL
jgi:hypothetical protein